jgi:hypothetical protein
MDFGIAEVLGNIECYQFLYLVRQTTQCKKKYCVL